MNSFSQRDSANNKFGVGIAPLQFISPSEDGLFVQYKLNEIISFELGGGIYNLIKHPFVDLAAINGFSIRSAIILNKECGAFMHKDDCHYFKLLLFYRQMKYKNRGYYPETDGIFENASIHHYFINGGSERENTIVQMADEIKNIFCLQFLTGKRYLFGKKDHFSFDYYWGFGLRVKYRELSITQDNTVSPYYLTPVVSPEEEIITSLLPSIHFGINFGYSF